MTAPVTAEEIARLRALEQAATPGPWEVEDSPDPARQRFVESASTGEHIAEHRTRADATLGANARNALVPLLDALAAERARVTMLLDRCAALEAALLERV